MSFPFLTFCRVENKNELLWKCTFGLFRAVAFSFKKAYLSITTKSRFQIIFSKNIYFESNKILGKLLQYRVVRIYPNNKNKFSFEGRELHFLLHEGDQPKLQPKTKTNSS